MSTRTHPIAPEELMAFLDKELSGAEAREVSRHLEQCAECSSIAEKFRRTSRSLSEWSVPAVPRTLEDTVKELASRKGSGGKIGKAGIFVRASFWSWKQWAAGIGATAAAVLLLLASTAGRMERHAMTVDRPHIEAGNKGISADNAAVDGRAGSSVGGTVGKLPAEGELINEQQSKVFTNQIPPQATTGFADASSGPGQGVVERGQNIVNVVPMIARTVSLAIVTKDFVASRASLDGILARRHGYAAQLNVSTAENAPRSLLASLRIPAAELASAVGELKTLGRVENESQSGEEVTQQHADLVVRLKNSRETEHRLQAILTQRTGKMSDVLEVEQEIARVRGGIEGMEAEQKNLEHRVEFATVNLQLSEEYKAQLNPPAASISTRIHNASVAGFQNLSETALGIVVFFFEDGPTMLFWLIAILAPVWFFWRRYRRALVTA